MASDTTSDAAELPAALERNLRLLWWHRGLTSAYVWIPVFVLFTRARFDLHGALRLASLYYLFVVAIEVPSGWMSDRLGRITTLRVAGSCFVGAHLCFALGDDRFSVIVLGQFLLAGGFASISGTDVTFHYDTVEALGRAEEYADRQARVSAVGYTVTAVSALVGGALGLIDVRLAFVVGIVVGIGQLVVTLGFTEPPVSTKAGSLFNQLGTCLRYLSGRYLGWLFFYGFVLVTLEHVAFTLMQPWLTDVLGRTADDLGSTPLISGMVFAATSAVGALAARASAPLGHRFGVVATLIGLAVLSSIIVSAMALFVNAAVLILVAFRSAQGAAAPVLISAAVAPRVEQRHRATLLSLNSLAGRLGFGLVLLFVSTDAEDDVGRVLTMFSITAWTLVAVLAVSAYLWAPRRATIPL